MIIENEIPILEYSTESIGIIDPKTSKEPFPRLCIMTFFRDVLESFLGKYQSEKIGTYVSEMREFNAYKLKYKETEICIGCTETEWKCCYAADAAVCLWIFRQVM